MTLALLKMESRNSILSNINDNGDNNEKQKKIKMWVGILKNMGGNIPGTNFLGGSFPGGILMVRNFSGGNFPGGSFTDTRN